MAGGLVGSEILRIAADIRGLIRSGKKILQSDGGDFDTKQFPIPVKLKTEIGKAPGTGGETNYPPSDGVLELRQASSATTSASSGSFYPVESVLIASAPGPSSTGSTAPSSTRATASSYPLPS